MPNPLVILHGYSDTSDSFQPLADALGASLGVQPAVISLGEYVTLNDYVSYVDLLAGLEKAWSDHGLPRTEGSVDMVVHSTGALVARQWLDWLTKSQNAPCPVKRLCMLAPANFGSPLAHKGQSFIGRVVKGSQANSDGPLQSGREVLKGLELASPFTWNLAGSDLFGPNTIYKTGRCLCTVLVGNKGYDGLAAMANEDGSDGTVRVSTANLNCARLMMDFTADPQNPVSKLESSTATAAFGFLEKYNHSTVALKETPPSLRQPLVDLITGALTVDDAGFKAWCDKLDAITAATTDKQDAYQNTVVHCVDDVGESGRPVKDYIVEFYEDDKDGGALAKFFHTTALENVHNYADDPSFRSLYVNVSKLKKRIDKNDETLLVSLTAHPQLSETYNRVGFLTFNDADIGAMTVPAAAIGEYFAPHRTLLVTIRIRWNRGRLFGFRQADEPFAPI